MEKLPPRVAIKFSIEVYPDKRRRPRVSLWAGVCGLVIYLVRKLGQWWP